MHSSLDSWCFERTSKSFEACVVRLFLCANEIKLNEKPWHPSRRWERAGAWPRTANSQDRGLLCVWRKGLCFGFLCCSKERFSCAASGHWKKTQSSPNPLPAGLKRVAPLFWREMFFPWGDGSQLKAGPCYVDTAGWCSNHLQSPSTVHWLNEIQ